MASRSLPCSLALCLVALHAPAQQPSGEQRSGADMQAFVGTWQLDAARSKSGTVTLSYQLVGDQIRAITPRGSYNFKIDGNEYPTAVKGEMITWKQVGKNTIETTSKQGGKIQAVATRVFSSDGKTATLSMKLIRDTTTTVTGRMERQNEPAGTHPLIGTWKQGFENRPDQFRRVTYTPIAHGLHVRYEGGNGDEYDLILDEKPRPVTTNRADLTARRIDERTIEEQWSRDGKVFSKSTITVSPDGQELTERQGPPDAHNEPAILVHRRTK